MACHAVKLTTRRAVSKGPVPSQAEEAVLCGELQEGVKACWPCPWGEDEGFGKYSCVSQREEREVLA